MTAVYFTFRRRPPRPRQLLKQPMSPLKAIDMRNRATVHKQELDHIKHTNLPQENQKCPRKSLFFTVLDCLFVPGPIFNPQVSTIFDR